MKKCPECKQWSLEYDAYFGRYRCFSCEWMAPSSAEREIRLLKEYQAPTPVYRQEIPDLKLTLEAAYDSVNDALLFDFGIKEPTYDLPEPNGRLIWKIAYLSDELAGFAILGAKHFGVSEVEIDIKARKENIEKILRKLPDAFNAGRPTRNLIERVELTVKSIQPENSTPQLKNALENFERTCVE